MFRAAQAIHAAQHKQYMAWTKGGAYRDLPAVQACEAVWQMHAWMARHGGASRPVHQLVGVPAVEAPIWALCEVARLDRRRGVPSRVVCHLLPVCTVLALLAKLGVFHHIGGAATVKD